LLFPLLSFKFSFLELECLLKLEFLLLMLEFVLSVEKRIQSGGCLGKTFGFKSKKLLIVLYSQLLSCSLSLELPLLLLSLVL
jgi:hypothetical protein